MNMKRDIYPLLLCILYILEWMYTKPVIHKKANLFYLYFLLRITTLRLSILENPNTIYDISDLFLILSGKLLLLYYFYQVKCHLGNYLLSNWSIFTLPYPYKESGFWFAFDVKITIKSPNFLLTHLRISSLIHHR